MTITKVANAGDIAEGALVPADANGHKLLLTRVEGVIHAMARKCPHMGADLCGGRIAGDAVVCPKHGAAFAVTSGEPVAPAKVLFLKMTPKPLATYPVTIVGDDVMVTVS